MLPQIERPCAGREISKGAQKLLLPRDRNKKSRETIEAIYRNVPQISSIRGRNQFERSDPGERALSFAKT